MTGNPAVVGRVPFPVMPTNHPELLDELQGLIGDYNCAHLMAPITQRPLGRPRGHLLRILGVGFGIAVIVGGAIGSGILRTPGLVAAQLGSPGFIVGV
jgi:hypothetical protein